MKKILLSFVGLLIGASAFAGQGYSQYSTGGFTFNGSAATNYVVITAESKNGGDPVITYLNATSDLAGSKLQWYLSTNKTIVTAVPGFTNTSTVCYVNSTNLFVAGDLVVVEHLFSANLTDAANFYELNTASTFGAPVWTNIVSSGGAQGFAGPTTNFVYAFTNGFALAVTNMPGDIIYQMTKVGAGAIPIGAATVSLTGAGIYSGNRNKPLLGILNGTSAATINAVSATFVP